MTLESTPLDKGQSVYLKLPGQQTWKQGTVLDVNEHLKAARVAYPGCISGIWMTVESLKRTRPEGK